MKILKCKQGGAAWLKARCGRPTASRWSDIVTPTGKAVSGKSKRSYMLELCAERLTGKAQEHFVTAAMERGQNLEPNALAFYTIATGKAVQRVGLVLDDSLRWGCSPDGLVGVGGVECKCPGRVALLDMLDSHLPDPDYTLQMQACMWICNAPVWDFVLFTDEPGIPSATWEVQADAKLHESFAAIIPAFCDELDALEANMRELGGGVENTAEMYRRVTDATLPDWLQGLGEDA